MQLGALIGELDDETRASELLAASGDLVLMAQVHAMAARFDENAGEYVGGSVRRFANLASDEEWLALMTAMERAPDPSAACLVHMIGWSLRKDSHAASGSQAHAGCSCSGAGCS